jgi:4-carboxymuconolactone decarboxylase
MPRIPLPTPETLTLQQRKVYDAVVAGPRGTLRGPLRAALHNPELADRWQRLGALLRYETCLAPRLSELAILVTARHWDCQFEWYAHEPEALRGGLAPAVIDALKHGTRPQFERRDELAVYEFSAELHRTRVVSETTYAVALEQLGVVGIVELTALIGYYTMVAMTLIAHELPLPAGEAAPLPALSRER